MQLTGLIAEAGGAALREVCDHRCFAHLHGAAKTKKVPAKVRPCALAGTWQACFKRLDAVDWPAFRCATSMPLTDRRRLLKATPAVAIAGVARKSVERVRFLAATCFPSTFLIGRRLICELGWTPHRGGMRLGLSDWVSAGFFSNCRNTGIAAAPPRSAASASRSYWPSCSAT